MNRSPYFPTPPTIYVDEGIEGYFYDEPSSFVARPPRPRSSSFSSLQLPTYFSSSSNFFPNYFPSPSSTMMLMMNPITFSPSLNNIDTIPPTPTTTTTTSFSFDRRPHAFSTLNNNANNQSTTMMLNHLIHNHMNHNNNNSHQTTSTSDRVSSLGGRIIQSQQPQHQQQQQQQPTTALPNSLSNSSTNGLTITIGNGPNSTNASNINNHSSHRLNSDFTNGSVSQY